MESGVKSQTSMGRGKAILFEYGDNFAYFQTVSDILLHEVAQTESVRNSLRKEGKNLGSFLTTANHCVKWV